MKDYESHLAVSSEKKSGYLLVSFDGEFDKAGLAEHQKTLCDLAENLEVPVMVLDFTQLQFINSEAIGFLLTLQAKVVKREKKMALVGASDHVRDVLDVIGLLKILSHFPSLQEFEKTLS